MKTMRTKKALVNWQIILVILAVITFIIIFFWAKDALDDSRYETSLFECNQLLSSAVSTPMSSLTFFKDGEPRLDFINAIETKCPSKEISISKNNIDDAADLVYDCWQKTGKGVEILNSNSYGESICLFCGYIKSDDTISNFDEKFKEEIKNKKYQDLFQSSSQILSLNNDTLLDLLPKNLDSENPILIMYFIYKPEYEGSSFADTTFHLAKDKVLNFITSFGGSVAAVTKMIDSNDVQSLGGIYLQSWSNADTSKDFSKANQLTVAQKNSKIPCKTFIIPNDNFN